MLTYIRAVAIANLLLSKDTFLYFWNLIFGSSFLPSTYFALRAQSVLLLLITRKELRCCGKKLLAVSTALFVHALLQNGYGIFLEYTWCRERLHLRYIVKHSIPEK